MLYYDDRDFYNAENIEELYDEDDMIFEDDDDSDSWEYNYHNIEQELDDE